MKRYQAALLFFELLLPALSAGEVVGIDVATRNDVSEGKSYGVAGPYEKVTGKLYFEIDQDAEVNQRIVDVEFAPSNAAGRVAFAADFCLIKPKSIDAGNGAVLFEVPNRGRLGMLGRFNRGATRSNDPQTAADFGDGFLLRQGFTLFWVGWQFDVPREPHHLRAYVPPAAHETRPIRGLVRSDFFVTEKTFQHSLGDRGHVPYPVADPGDARNVMTVRTGPTNEPVVIDRERWQFARREGEEIVPDPGHVYLHDGFEPGRIYEVVYVAEAPVVAGLGLAAIRDAIAYLRHGGVEELSISAGAIDRAVAYGASQSGRLLRTFLYDGFNEDEGGRRVFDGVMAHIAGGQRGGFNQRFAQPSRSGEMNFFYPNAMFPFTDTLQADPVTGRRDGLLTNIGAGFVPKIFYTNSSTEYWISPAALSHMSVDAARDLPPPSTTRIYHFAGTQHAPASFPPARDAQASNPNDYGWFLRALLLAMDRWITDGSEPPSSRYPGLASGTLVAPEELAFPDGVGVVPPDETPLAYRLDFGADFPEDRIIAREPPWRGTPYPQRVPQVDANGNELGGLKTPELAVPLATYTGWQPFDSDAEPLYVPLGRGLYLPFARTETERHGTGDPRPSIEARYGSRDRYLGLTTEAALELVDAGYLLASDLAAVLEQSLRHWDYLMSSGGD